MKDLREDGYTVMRTSGSHGVYDVIAIKDLTFRFIQCKVTENENTIKTLRKEFKHNSIIKSDYDNEGQDIIIRPELAVKIHGKSGYHIYPIGS